MANLFVLSFPDVAGAEGALDEVSELQKQQLITIEDAAIAVHPIDGKVKVKQAKSLTKAGAMGGALWGMLFGLIFFVPVAGLVAGAATGALAGKLHDYGIDDTFIKQVSEKVTPGTSALFMLVHDAQSDKVIEALRPFGAELVQSSLSPEQESQLREALAG